MEYFQQLKSGASVVIEQTSGPLMMIRQFSNDTDLHNAALETSLRALEIILDDEF
ncbi:hypothetical protein T10_5216 [Trichinella papuae]|uniref:Uncharacterized protein n=1 Tax=Trichinella papuae TaxID=268474 RepID=A0A0V1LYX7_9BILA|nr:hypothetical protein T10_5216 [Trichinella papuae]